MAMIQGIDAGALIDAFRQGRSNKAAQVKAERDAQRQQQVNGLLSQMMGGQPTLESQFASPRPQTTFGQAFSPDAMAGIQRGETPPLAPQPAPMASQAPTRTPDPNVLAKLIIIDPEMGGKIASAFKAMDESSLKNAEAKNAHMGATAHWLRQFPPQERAARLQGAMPALVSQGFTPQELQQAASDLSDSALSHYEAHAIDFDKMIDNELAQREFEAGKVTSVPENGMLVRTMPDGSSQIVAAPQGYQGGNSGGIPKAAQDYLKQHPELRDHFDEKYGKGASASILGGGASNGTGGFPSGQ